MLASAEGSGRASSADLAGVGMRKGLRAVGGRRDDIARSADARVQKRPAEVQKRRAQNIVACACTTSPPPLLAASSRHLRPRDCRQIASPALDCWVARDARQLRRGSISGGLAPRRPPSIPPNPPGPRPARCPARQIHRNPPRAPPAARDRRPGGHADLGPADSVSRASSWRASVPVDFFGPIR